MLACVRHLIPESDADTQEAQVKLEIEHEPMAGVDETVPFAPLVLANLMGINPGPRPRKDDSRMPPAETKKEATRAATLQEDN